MSDAIYNGFRGGESWLAVAGIGLLALGGAILVGAMLSLLRGRGRRTRRGRPNTGALVDVTLDAPPTEAAEHGLLEQGRSWEAAARRLSVEIDEMENVVTVLQGRLDAIDQGPGRILRPGSGADPIRSPRNRTSEAGAGAQETFATEGMDP